jgi:branched-subunit amino acid ABC-type transport system permease component
MEKAGLPFALAYPAAGIGAAFFAVIIGLPVLRLRGHYFAITTLGVAEAIKALVQNLTITEGNAGIYLPMLNLSVRHQYLFFYYMMLSTLVLSLLTTYLILKAKFGYSLIAIRENEQAADSAGINTTVTKTIAFALSGFFTGLAGGVYAYQQAFIYPGPVFAVQMTVKMIVILSTRPLVWFRDCLYPNFHCQPDYPAIRSSDPKFQIPFRIWAENGSAVPSQSTSPTSPLSISPSNCLLMASFLNSLSS